MPEVSGEISVVRRIAQNLVTNVQVDPVLGSMPENLRDEIPYIQTKNRALAHRVVTAG